MWTISKVPVALCVRIRRPCLIFCDARSKISTFN